MSLEGKKLTLTCTSHIELKTERLLKLFLSLVVFLLICSCKSKEEKVEEALNFGKRAGYQGSPICMNAFAYIKEIDSTNAEAYRELSIPYLKRGIPHEWKKWIDKAVRFDSIAWQPYRGYNYLWFYRDYKKAIADFNASDTLTPHIDYPQGHSVDYWRGIAYLGLKDYQNSIKYWNKHILKETLDSGEDWVEINAFLYRGIAHMELGNQEKAFNDFDKVIHYFKKSADAKYWKAKILYCQGENEMSLSLLSEAEDDFNDGYYNSRPYVETLYQIYLSDIKQLKYSLLP